MSNFEWPIRVYYEDTDSGGVVYHSNYLNFMERARTEWLRSLGFEQDELITNHQCIFAVHSMQLKFRRPAKFNDLLLLQSRITDLSGASFEFEQKIFRDDELLCEAVVKIACLNSTRFRPMAIPPSLLTEIQGAR
ncbi:MAG: tol-pal system-associated acyl-CoA thioesterase [Methylophaga sp.]|nr:MAG: tol-pal system-associated acyl-CoA thioesterase [Methylophaga sp.]